MTRYYKTNKKKAFSLVVRNIILHVCKKIKDTSTYISLRTNQKQHQQIYTQTHLQWKRMFFSAPNFQLASSTLKKKKDQEFKVVPFIVITNIKLFCCSS